MEKPAPTSVSLIDPIRNRWSPRAFDANRPVPAEVLLQLFEAARWAPSCNNSQAWNFIVATQDEPEFADLLECLVPGNRAWAEAAPVLVLAAAELNFSFNGKPNAFARHDVGLALGNLLAQATALGVQGHLMAGFSADTAREKLGLPDTHEPVTMLALGYPGDPESLSEPLRERELAERLRKPLDAFVFKGRFGQSRSF